MKNILKSVMFLILTVTIGIGMQSCSSVKPIDKTKLNGQWVLKTLESENAVTAFKGPMPSIEFDFEKNLVYGSGGCNRYTGGFLLTDKNEFSAPALASTMMMCIEENKESQFLAILSEPNLLISVEKDGSLSFSKDKKLLLSFTKDMSPKTETFSTEALVGHWVLTSIGGEDLGKLFSGKVPTIEFDSEGKVFGNGGCNSYRGTFKLDDNTLDFGPLMSTKMACPGLEGEGKFMGLLSTPVQAKIDGQTLTFLKDGKVVLEFSKK